MKQFFCICMCLIFVMFMAPHVFGQTDAFIPSNGDTESVVRITSSVDPIQITSVALADTPYGAAVTPDGSYVLVTREDSLQDPDDPDSGGLVTAIPLSGFGTVDPTDIHVGRRPRGVAVDSEGVYAYVANFDDDTVTEVRLQNRSVSDTIDLTVLGPCDEDNPCGPWGVAAIYDEVEGTPKVYVSNHLHNSISVITNSEVQTLTNVGNGPLGLALTPDGKFLYVANLNDNAVVIIDTDSLSVVATVGVGPEPWGVAVGNDGAFAYVTNSGSNNVTVIDTETLAPVATYNTSAGAHPMGIAGPKNGDFVYVVNQAVNVNNLEANNITKITHTASLAETIAEGEIDGAFALGAFFGGTPPTPPSSLSAEADSSSRIILTWTDNASDEAGFKIERREDGEETFIQVDKVDADETTYTDSGLARATTYEFRVRAFTEAADSDYSAPAAATTTDEKFSWCFIGSLLWE